MEITDTSLKDTVDALFIAGMPRHAHLKWSPLHVAFGYVIELKGGEKEWVLPATEDAEAMWVGHAIRWIKTMLFSKRTPLLERLCTRLRDTGDGRQFAQIAIISQLNLTSIKKAVLDE